MKKNEKQRLLEKDELAAHEGFQEVMKKLRELAKLLKLAKKGKNGK